MSDKGNKSAAAGPQEERKTNKERLKEITDSIETGIKEVFASEKYKNYLATMSRFHKYSANNTMLIFMQKPDATLVAGFNEWRDQFCYSPGQYGDRLRQQRRGAGAACL